jgi:hypothetical protein
VDALLAAIGELPGWNGTPLAAEFPKSVGVREGYSLERHTRMVLSQFERYFGSRAVLTASERALLRLTLSLHDAGKPRAVEEGDKAQQHVWTGRLLDAIEPHLRLSGADQALLRALVGSDPIGAFFQQLQGLQASAGEIRRAASTAAMPPGDFFRLLVVYFQADTASYTEEAGGLRSLERLFHLEPNGGLHFDPPLGRLRFNPHLEEAWEVLQEALSEPSA